MQGVKEKLESYFRIQGDIAVLEDSLSESKKKLQAISEELIEQMEDVGLTQVKDENGRIIYLKSPAVYASFKKDKKEEAIKFLKEEWDLGDFIQEGIAPTTLSRVIKEKMEQGEPIPEDFFSYYLKKKIGYRS